MVPLNIVIRAQSVKRWHIVETTKIQTLAEHSFNVAMIAKEIALRIGETVDFQMEMLWAGLRHDIEEVTYGDIPTPTKENLEIKIPKLNLRISEEGKIIVKLADILENEWFITHHCAATRHSRDVANGATARATAMIEHLENQNLAHVAWGIREELNQ